MALAIPMLFALLAQAEPASPEPVEPLPEAPAPAAAPTPTPDPDQPQTRLSLSAGVAYQATGDVRPKWGYAIGVSLARRCLDIGRLAHIDLRGQFDYERFSGVGAAFAEVDNTRTPYQADRTLSFFQFSAMPTLAVSLGPVQPWLGAGGGLVTGHFTTAEEAYLPGESKTTRPVLVGSVGLDVPLREHALVGLQIEYEDLLGSREFALQSGSVVHPFGNRLSARVAFSYEF